MINSIDTVKSLREFFSENKIDLFSTKTVRTEFNRYIENYTLGDMPCRVYLCNYFFLNKWHIIRVHKNSIVHMIIVNTRMILFPVVMLVDGKFFVTKNGKTEPLEINEYPYSK